MRSSCLWLTGFLASAAGCADDLPAPDISRLSVVMRWEADDRRSVEVSIVDRDLPCEGVEKGFLGESAVKCPSRPWKFSVDGVVGRPTPVTCWSAYDGLFGPVPKRCEGGTGKVTLADLEAEDVEILATTDDDDNVIVIPGVRRVYTFVEESPFQGGTPGIVRVDAELALQNDTFAALYTQPDGEIERGSALPGDGNRLQLSPFGVPAGAYPVRVLAVAHRDRGVQVAVPVEGSLTVGP